MRQFMDKFWIAAGVVWWVVCIFFIFLGFSVLMGCDSPTETASDPVVVVDTTTVPVGTAGTYTKVVSSSCAIEEVRLSRSELRIIERCSP